LISAGPDAAGPPLLKLFSDPARADLRSQILRAWADMHYTGCVDTLIGILDAENKFWGAQKIDTDWAKDHDSELTKQRLEHYSNLLGAVRTLGALRDARARPALEQTLARWGTIPYESQQVMDAVNESLKKLPN
jgi:hypothetical protein